MASTKSSVTAAQLGFLAIFNPSLGTTDETIDDQIVYYSSLTTQQQISRRRRTRNGRPTENVSQEERHERLRQIGLAQGMVSFSQGFADGAPVDTIDTEKARVVVKELEPGWWILAVCTPNAFPTPREDLCQLIRPCRLEHRPYKNPSSATTSDQIQ